MQLYDPSAVNPNRTKLAKALNVLHRIDAGGHVKAPWVKNLHGLLTGVPATADEQAGLRGPMRQLMDGWVQTAIFPTVASLPPSQRAEYARAMKAIGDYCSQEPLSAVELHHAKTTQCLWSNVAQTMAIDPSITGEELAAQVSDPQVRESLRRACDSLDVATLVLAGDNVKLAAKTVQDKVDRAAKRGHDPAAAAQAAKKKLEEDARILLEQQTLEQELQLKEAFENGILDAATVIDVLGHEPEWLTATMPPLEEVDGNTVADEPPAVELGHDPSGTGKTPGEIVHDEGITAVMVGPMGVPLPTLRETTEREMSAPGIAGIVSQQQGFGISGAHTSQSHAAQDTTSSAPPTQQQGALNVDFE